MEAIVVLVDVLSTARLLCTLSSGLPQIPEPVCHFPNIPVKTKRFCVSVSVIRWGKETMNGVVHDAVGL